MRLCDQVFQASTSIKVSDAIGHYSVPAVGNLAASVSACPTRFVLTDKTASFCRSLLVTDQGMLVSQNEHLRLPLPEFWVEWLAAQEKGGEAGSRVGALVEADEAGRAASVRFFYEQADGEPVAAQVIVELDLDRNGIRDSDNLAFWILPGAHPLADHVTFRSAPEWRSYFAVQTVEDIRAGMGLITNTVLAELEFLLVFSALLAERTCLTEADVDLGRLNGQRIQKGRPLLLNHTEVRLDLTPAASRSLGEARSGRETACLHSVRGHLVNRGGRSFWRRSHFRGDPGRLPRTRNVTVIGGWKTPE